MEDLISVIVPVYKVEKYIHKCIDSIINQTYKNLEIILVDDGSPDNCGKICDEYAQKDKRVKVIHKENGGVSSARNAGLKEAKGKWISFVDADDWIEENYCEKMLINAQKEDADVVLCGYNRVTINHIEKINMIAKKNKINANEYLVNALNPQTGFGFSCIKLIKACKIGSVKFDTELKVGEDALFNIQLSNNIKKAIVIEDNLYNYRLNKESVVKKFDIGYPNKYMSSMIKCKSYIWNNYKDDNKIIQNYYNFVAFHVMLIAVNYCYHPENLEKNKKNMLKEICDRDILKEGIEHSNYDNISFTRKVTLFTLKHHLYTITKIICLIRQKQSRS